MKKLNNNILFIQNSTDYILVHKNGKCPNKETAHAMTGSSTFRHLYQSWDDRKQIFPVSIAEEKY